MNYLRLVLFLVSFWSRGVEGQEGGKLASYDSRSCAESGDGSGGSRRGSVVVIR